MPWWAYLLAGFGFCSLISTAVVAVLLALHLIRDLMESQWIRSEIPDRVPTEWEKEVHTHYVRRLHRELGGKHGS